MRTIKRVAKFRRDFKREMKGRHKEVLQREFVRLVELLADDVPLAEKYGDHSLTGNWSDCRDCHIKPDLVLIYRKTDDDILHLLRLGTHAELGL